MDNYYQLLVLVLGAWIKFAAFSSNGSFVVEISTSISYSGEWSGITAKWDIPASIKTVQCKLGNTGLYSFFLLSYYMTVHA